jgi:hypothetical protein
MKGVGTRMGTRGRKKDGMKERGREGRREGGCDGQKFAIKPDLYMNRWGWGRG